MISPVITAVHNNLNFFEVLAPSILFFQSVHHGFISIKIVFLIRTMSSSSSSSRHDPSQNFKSRYDPLPSDPKQREATWAQHTADQQQWTALAHPGSNDEDAAYARYQRHNSEAERREKEYVSLRNGGAGKLKGKSAQIHFSAGFTCEWSKCFCSEKINLSSEPETFS